MTVSSHTTNRQASVHGLGHPPVRTRVTLEHHEAVPDRVTMDRWDAYVARRASQGLSLHPSWPVVLADGLGHRPLWIEARDESGTRGLLPLAYVRSLIFGRFLVGLPYLNVGGAMADDDETALAMIDRAIDLADHLNVRYLELRHERAIDHPRLTTRAGHKVHMRRPLPATSEALWKGLDPKVRNQVRKGQKSGLSVHWGGAALLEEFYDVFSRNMRDLGTPVFGRSLFRAILAHFPEDAELCVARLDGSKAVAAGLLLHGRGVTEVPSASSLRGYNKTCANMVMYWSLLERAIQRRQATFDFGRSTPGGPTYRFKAQWGALSHEAPWQRYERVPGEDLRPQNPRFALLVEAWKRLPVPLTRAIGPPLVRGIP